MYKQIFFFMMKKFELFRKIVLYTSDVFCNTSAIPY